MDKFIGIIIIVLNIAGLCFVAVMFFSAKKKEAVNRHGRNKNYSPGNRKPGKGHKGFDDMSASAKDDIFDDMDLMDFDDLDLDDFD